MSPGRFVGNDSVDSVDGGHGDFLYPICSMYIYILYMEYIWNNIYIYIYFILYICGIFTNMNGVWKIYWRLGHKMVVNVAKYSIHGACGYGKLNGISQFPIPKSWRVTEIGSDLILGRLHLKKTLNINHVGGLVCWYVCWFFRKGTIHLYQKSLSWRHRARLYASKLDKRWQVHLWSSRS